MKVFKCGHCSYIGVCYGAMIGGKVSAPWCTQCKRNDKLIEVA